MKALISSIMPGLYFIQPMGEAEKAGWKPATVAADTAQKALKRYKKDFAP